MTRNLSRGLAAVIAVVALTAACGADVWESPSAAAPDRSEAATTRPPEGPRCESYLVRLEALTAQGEAILDRAERLTAAEWTGPKGLTLLADQLDWGADVNDFARSGAAGRSDDCTAAQLGRLDRLSGRVDRSAARFDALGR